MKRIKLDYTINGKQEELYVEPMDQHHRMFSLERGLMDAHPLLIEHGDQGWRVKSQDDWSLSPEEVEKLALFIESEYPNRPQE